MTQSTSIQPTSKVGTASTATLTVPKTRKVEKCQECPYFTNYNEQFGRGWCQKNNCMTKEHSLPTTDCHVETLNVPDDYFSVSVHLTSKAVVEQDGYPVPEDNRVIEVKVSEVTVEEIKKPLSRIIDLEAYNIFSFWRTEIEDPHVYQF